MLRLVWAKDELPLAACRRDQIGMAVLTVYPLLHRTEIDAKTMELHHDKHHAAYVNNLNAALRDYPEIASLPLEQILSKLDQMPDTVRTAVRNNAGGHANHPMFWQVMAKDRAQPEGGLKTAIDHDFGGLHRRSRRLNSIAGFETGMPANGYG
jgi:superoxide dismutase